MEKSKESLDEVLSRFGVKREDTKISLKAAMNSSGE